MIPFNSMSELNDVEMGKFVYSFKMNAPLKSAPLLPPSS